MIYILIGLMGILLMMIFETIPYFLYVFCARHGFLTCILPQYVLYQINQCFADAHNTFNLFDKKGDGRVSTKELEKVFKSLALQINDEQLKEWADEMDEEGIDTDQCLYNATRVMILMVFIKHLYFHLRRLCTLVHDHW